MLEVPYQLLSAHNSYKQIVIRSQFARLNCYPHSFHTARDLSPIVIRSQFGEDNCYPLTIPPCQLLSAHNLSCLLESVRQLLSAHNFRLVIVIRSQFGTPNCYPLTIMQSC